MRLFAEALVKAIEELMFGRRSQRHDERRS